MSQGSIRVTVSSDVAVDDVLRAVDDGALAAECARRGLLVIGDEPVVGGAEIRGARGLLNWSLADLADTSGVSVSTIKRLEDGTQGCSIRASKLDAIRAALQGNGVAFRNLSGATCISRTALSCPETRVPA